MRKPNFNKSESKPVEVKQTPKPKTFIKPEMPSIKEVIKDLETNTDSMYNFYQFKCKPEELKDRLNSLLPKLKYLVKEGLVNGSKNKVLFRNDLQGTKYYDAIKILDSTGKVLGTVIPDTGKKEPGCVITYSEHFPDGRVETYEAELKNWTAFKTEMKDKEQKDLIKSYWYIND